MSIKQDLRTEARRRRAALMRADFASRIASFVDELQLAPGAVVAGYFPVRDEADPRALMAALAAKGHPLALPVVEPDKPLLFRRWRMGEPLHANAYGIPEPPATAPVVVPALVLVPLLAFDREGHRLGYGGGYYDRTLEMLTQAQALGIAFAGQDVPRLPHEMHDRPLDAVLTENGLRKFSRKAQP